MYKVELTVCDSDNNRSWLLHVFESLYDAANFIEGVVFLKDVEAVYLEKFDDYQFHEDEHNLPF